MQGFRGTPTTLPPHMDPAAWDIIREFALSDSITVDQDWLPAINAVLNAENDTDLAIQEVEKLAAAAANTSHLKIHIQGQSDKQPAPQIIAVEKDLQMVVTELFRLRGIKGSIPSVDELVEPEEEHDIQAEAWKITERLSMWMIVRRRKVAHPQASVFPMPARCARNLRQHAGSLATQTTDLPYHTNCVVSVASSGAWR